MKYLDVCSCYIIPLLCQGCPFRPSRYILTLFFPPYYSLIYKGHVIIFNIFFAFLLPQIKDTPACTKGLLPVFGQSTKLKRCMRRLFSKKGEEAPAGLEVVASTHLCTPQSPYWRIIIKYSFFPH